MSAQSASNSEKHTICICTNINFYPVIIGTQTLIKVKSMQRPGTEAIRAKTSPQNQNNYMEGSGSATIEQRSPSQAPKGRAGHVVLGNLMIIPDSRFRNIVSKGPKYRFPSHIDFDRCREEIASALNDFGTRWCKRESVECNAFKEWTLSIFNKVDKRIKYYSHNTNF